MLAGVVVFVSVQRPVVVRTGGCEHFASPTSVERGGAGSPASATITKIKPVVGQGPQGRTATPPLPKPALPHKEVCACNIAGAATTNATNAAGRSIVFIGALLFPEFPFWHPGWLQYTPARLGGNRFFGLIFRAACFQHTQTTGILARSHAPPLDARSASNPDPFHWPAERIPLYAAYLE